MDKCMLIITIPSAFTLDHIKQDIICTTIEFPVPPLQETEDQMRKWNIRFQQELTLVFDTENRQERKAGSSTLKNHFTSTKPFSRFKLRICG